MIGLLIQYGYAALFVLLVLGIVGLPVPDETLLTFCGYLIHSGRLRPDLTFAAALSGSVAGTSISYALGRRYGNSIVHRYGRYVHLIPDRLAQMQSLFARYGSGLLVCGYFIPGVRHFSALAAGMSGIHFGRFAAFAYSGAVVWVTVFLATGYFVGDRWQHTSEVFHRYTLIIVGILVLCSGVVYMLRRWR